jgi:hypothetical protein
MMNAKIWNHLPHELLMAEIVPKLCPADLLTLFRESIQDGVLCRQIILPAATFAVSAGIDTCDLKYYIAICALKHIPSRSEFYRFFESIDTFPRLCSTMYGADDLMGCIMRRGDLYILDDVIGGCSCCIDMVFRYAIDHGYLEVVRYMIWNFGLTMQVIFHALYDGNRVIVAEIMRALEISAASFLPTLEENMSYYLQLEELADYDCIPYVMDLSWQLQDPKTRRWLSKQLRYLSKLTKIKIYSFVVGFHRYQDIIDERERIEYMADMVEDY